MLATRRNARRAASKAKYANAEQPPRSGGVGAVRLLSLQASRGCREWRVNARRRRTEWRSREFGAAVFAAQECAGQGVVIANRAVKTRTPWIALRHSMRARSWSPTCAASQCKFWIDSHGGNFGRRSLSDSSATSRPLMHCPGGHCAALRRKSARAMTG